MIIVATCARLALVLAGAFRLSTPAIRSVGYIDGIAIPIDTLFSRACVSGIAAFRSIGYIDGTAIPIAALFRRARISGVAAFRSVGYRHRFTFTPPVALLRQAWIAARAT